MKARTLKRILALAICAGTAIVAQGQGLKYGKIDFQGYLTDEAGVPVPDGYRTILVSIWPDSAGGQPLWEDEIEVYTHNGLYSTTLQDFGDVFLGDARWLWIAVDGEEMSPRIPFTSVPYAIRAMVADSLAGGIPGGIGGGGTPGRIAQFTGARMIGDSEIYQSPGNNIGIGQPSPSDKLDVNGRIRFSTGTDHTILSNHTGGLLIESTHLGAFAGVRLLPYEDDIWMQNSVSSGDINFSGMAGVDLTGNILFRTTGKVGIGTTSPAYKLDVSGDIRASGTVYGTIDNADKVDGLHASDLGRSTRLDGITGTYVFEIPDITPFTMTLAVNPWGYPDDCVGFVHCMESDGKIAWNGFDGAGAAVRGSAELITSTTIMTLAGGAVVLKTPSEALYPFKLKVTATEPVDILLVW